MTDITTVSFPFCYLCLETDGQLVRPCNNPKCSLRAHNTCMKQKSRYGSINKRNCDICTSPIIVQQKKTFNTGKCCISFLKLFYTLFMIIGGVTSIIFLVFGKSIISMSNGTCIECGNGIIATMWLWITPFIAIFPQIPQLHNNTCCICSLTFDIFKYFTNREIKHKHYFTMLIMYIVSVILVLGAHGIGQLVYKYKYDTYETFNIRTSFAGIMIYYIFIAILLGIFIIAKISQCIWISTSNTFSTYDVEYGTIVDDSNY